MNSSYGGEKNHVNKDIQYRDIVPSGLSLSFSNDYQREFPASGLSVMVLPH